MVRLLVNKLRQEEIERATERKGAASFTDSRVDGVNGTRDAAKKQVTTPSPTAPRPKLQRDASNTSRREIEVQMVGPTNSAPVSKKADAPAQNTKIRRTDAAVEKNHGSQSRRQLVAPKADAVLMKSKDKETSFKNKDIQSASPTDDRNDVSPAAKRADTNERDQPVENDSKHHQIDDNNKNVKLRPSEPAKLEKAAKNSYAEKQKKRTGKLSQQKGKTRPEPTMENSDGPAANHGIASKRSARHKKKHHSEKSGESRAKKDRGSTTAVKRRNKKKHLKTGKIGSFASSTKRATLPNQDSSVIQLASVNKEATRSQENAEVDESQIPRDKNKTRDAPSIRGAPSLVSTLSKGEDAVEAIIGPDMDGAAQQTSMLSDLLHIPSLANLTNLTSWTEDILGFRHETASKGEDQNTEPIDAVPREKEAELVEEKVQMKDTNKFRVHLSIEYLDGLLTTLVRKRRLKKKERDNSVTYGFVALESAVVKAKSRMCLSHPITRKIDRDLVSKHRVTWLKDKKTDRKNSTLHFSISLRPDDSHGTGEVAFVVEPVVLVVGIKLGDEEIPLGTTTLLIDGTNVDKKKMKLALKPVPLEANRSRGLFRRKNNSDDKKTFKQDDIAYDLEETATLKVKVDIKGGVMGFVANEGEKTDPKRALQLSEIPVDCDADEKQTVSSDVGHETRENTAGQRSLEISAPDPAVVVAEKETVKEVNANDVEQNSSQANPATNETSVNADDTRSPSFSMFDLKGVPPSPSMLSTLSGYFTIKDQGTTPPVRETDVPAAKTKEPETVDSQPAQAEHVVNANTAVGSKEQIATVKSRSVQKPTKHFAFESDDETCDRSYVGTARTEGLTTLYPLSIFESAYTGTLPGAMVEITSDSARDVVESNEKVDLSHSKPKSAATNASIHSETGRGKSPNFHAKSMKEEIDGSSVRNPAELSYSSNPTRYFEWIFGSPVVANKRETEQATDTQNQNDGRKAKSLIVQRATTQLPDLECDQNLPKSPVVQNPRTPRNTVEETKHAAPKEGEPRSLSVPEENKLTSVTTNVSPKAPSLAEEPRGAIGQGSAALKPAETCSPSSQMKGTKKRSIFGLRKPKEEKEEQQQQPVAPEIVPVPIQEEAKVERPIERFLKHSASEMSSHQGTYGSAESTLLKSPSLSFSRCESSDSDSTESSTSSDEQSDAAGDLLYQSASGRLGRSHSYSIATTSGYDSKVSEISSSSGSEYTDSGSETSGSFSTSSSSEFSSGDMSYSSSSFDTSSSSSDSFGKIDDVSLATKQLLKVADELGMEPDELIDRMDAGEDIENLMSAKRARRDKV